MQHLGYFLAIFLLLAFVAVALIVLIRRRKKRGACPHLQLFSQLFLFLKCGVFDVLPFFKEWSTSRGDMSGKARLHHVSGC